MSQPAIVCEITMSIDYALGAIVTLGILVYLVIALLRPERF
jgi:K+-transporting ATPase KdpF subunit